MLAIKKPLSPVLKISLNFMLAIMFLAAIALRISLYHVESSDYTVFLSQWYDYIQTHGGFAAFKSSFSNYNVPYLYLLALTTYLPIPKLIAIKTISVLFDGLLALFTYRIISLKYKRSYAAIAGVLVLLFAPTIFINSAAWGQADATYTAFCLGSLYFLLKDKPGWACVFFALAISFKLQAIFFAPVLLILLLKKRMPLKYLVLIPLIFLLLLAPAFIAGRDAWSLLTIYAGQVNTGGVGGAGQFNSGRTGSFNGGAGRFPGSSTGSSSGSGTRQFNGGGQFSGGKFGGQSSSSSSLTLNAPSFYQWLSSSAPDYWKWIGIGLAGAFIALVGILVLASKQKITGPVMLKVALIFALAIPFLLPEMHERYFFLADVLSIIYAFYFPRYFYIALIMQLCSLLSYSPYFLNTEVFPLSYVTFGVLVINIIALTDLVLTLYPSIRKKIVGPDSSGDNGIQKGTDGDAISSTSSKAVR